MDFDENRFSFCEKVDLHVTTDANLRSVVAVACEHSFRGIVVGSNKLESLVKIINNHGDKAIKAICMVDYPLGNGSMDIRSYAIISAKEKGAKEVEICAPYDLINEENFQQLLEDGQNLIKISSKYDVPLKYIIDKSRLNCSDETQAKVYKMIGSLKIPCVSTHLDNMRKNHSRSDDIINMRNLKSKISTSVKVFLENCDVEDFSSCAKAGADIIGLDWTLAPNFTHMYEDMVMSGQ